MIHTAFLILVDPEQAADVNFALKGYDLVVLDDLLISPRTFSLVASTLKHLNNCPSILVAGDNCQQHPLQTVGGKVHNTISILSDGTFNATTRSSTHCISVQSAGPGLWPLPGSRALHAAHSGSTGQVPGGGRPLHSLSPGRQGDIHGLQPSAFRHKHPS